jgi:hypothetical protein
LVLVKGKSPSRRQVAVTEFCQVFFLTLAKEGSNGPLCESLWRELWEALGKGSFFTECLVDGLFAK